MPLAITDIGLQQTMGPNPQERGGGRRGAAPRVEGFVDGSSRGHDQSTAQNTDVVESTGPNSTAAGSVEVGRGRSQTKLRGAFDRTPPRNGPKLSRNFCEFGAESTDLRQSQGDIERTVPKSAPAELRPRSPVFARACARRDAQAVLCLDHHCRGEGDDNMHK